MFYISIGYPMGYRRMQDRDEFEYFMEIRGKFVAVTRPELDLWTNINNIKKEKIDENILNSLEEKGLVIGSDNISELFDKLLNYSVMRQGIGWVNDSKPCILTMNKVAFHPTLLQTIIWINGYGQFILKGIVEKRCINDFDIASESFKKQFVEDIIKLIRYSVIMVV